MCGVPFALAGFVVRFEAFRFGRARKRCSRAERGGDRVRTLREIFFARLFKGENDFIDVRLRFVQRFFRVTIRKIPRPKIRIPLSTKTRAFCRNRCRKMCTGGKGKLFFRAMLQRASRSNSVLFGRRERVSKNGGGKSPVFVSFSRGLRRLCGDTFRDFFAGILPAYRRICVRSAVKIKKG